MHIYIHIYVYRLSNYIICFISSVSPRVKDGAKHHQNATYMYISRKPISRETNCCACCMPPQCPCSYHHFGPMFSHRVNRSRLQLHAPWGPTRLPA